MSYLQRPLSSPQRHAADATARQRGQGGDLAASRRCRVRSLPRFAPRGVQHDFVFDRKILEGPEKQSRPRKKRCSVSARKGAGEIRQLARCVSAAAKKEPAAPLPSFYARAPSSHADTARFFFICHLPFHFVCTPASYGAYPLFCLLGLIATQPAQIFFLRRFSRSAILNSRALSVRRIFFPRLFSYIPLLA